MEDELYEEAVAFERSIIRSLTGHFLMKQTETGMEQGRSNQSREVGSRIVRVTNSKKEPLYFKSFLVFTEL